MLKIKNIVSLFTLLAGISAGQVWGMEEDAKAFVIGISHPENGDIEIYGGDVQNISNSLTPVKNKLNKKNVYKTLINVNNVQKTKEECCGKICTMQIGGEKCTLFRYFTITKKKVETNFNFSTTEYNQLLTIMLELLPKNLVVTNALTEGLLKEQEEINKQEKKEEETESSYKQQLNNKFLKSNFEQEKLPEQPSKWATAWTSTLSALCGFTWGTLQSYLDTWEKTRDHKLTTGLTTVALTSATTGLCMRNRPVDTGYVIGAAAIATWIGSRCGNRVINASYEAIKNYCAQKFAKPTEVKK